MRNGLKISVEMLLRAKIKSQHQEMAQKQDSTLRFSSKSSVEMDLRALNAYRS